MKTLPRTLLIGSLALALTATITSTSLAQFGLFGFFGPHHHHHGWYRPYYSPAVVYSPVVVESTPTYAQPTYAQPDDTNPAPIISIQLVNPVENRVNLNYRLDDGVLQSLPAGSSVMVNQITVISFDRGNGAARARYQLTDGTYKFVVSGGLWELVHSTTPYQQATAYTAQQGTAQQAAGYANQQAAYSAQQGAAQPATAYASENAAPAAAN